MDSGELETTRRALHAVAELLLAGPQYRASGTIRLRVQPGGFATVADPELRVDRTELVSGGRRFTLQGATCAAVARAAGIDVGPPVGLYAEGCGADPDDVLDLDPAAAAWITDCFASGDAALRRFAPDQQPVLWPEHFDLGVAVDAVNYGVSPGDGYLAEPYAYVGPWTRRDGGFWNAPFGAVRPMRELTGVHAVEEFFSAGQTIARLDPPAADDD